MMRAVASHLLYWVGHWFSLLTDAVVEDWPRAPEWAMDWPYAASTRLLWWSSELDTDDRVWIKRHEGESDAAFEARCRERFPWLEEWD